MINCQRNFSAYNNLNEDCIECKEKICIIPVPVPISQAIPDEWFSSLVEELQSFKIEIFRKADEMRLEYYHFIGQRINETIADKSRSEVYGKKILHELAKCLQISERNLYYACEFARTMPELNYPEAKNWTHTKKLLDSSKGNVVEEKECKHQKETRIYCTKCGKRLE